MVLIPPLIVLCRDLHTAKQIHLISLSLCAPLEELLSSASLWLTYIFWVFGRLVAADALQVLVPVIGPKTTEYGAMS